VAENLPLRLVRTLLQEGYEAGYRRLHITGGEPLLWKGLLEILDHAYGIGYEAAILNTNGTILGKDMARSLSGYAGLTASVSLHGPRFLHDRFRGTGSYKRAVKGIEAALSAGVDTHIFNTVTRSLLPDLPRFADGLFQSFPGIKQLTFIQLIRVPDDWFDLSEELLTPEDFIDLVKVSSLLNLHGLKINLLSNPLATVVSRMIGMPWVPPSPPLYLEGSVIVLADRRVALAHSATESFGRYQAGNLRTILDSDKYRRAVLPDRSTCPACMHLRDCAEAGMVRPSEWCRDMQPDIPYCRRVLARATSIRQPRTDTGTPSDLLRNQPKA